MIRNVVFDFNGTMIFDNSIQKRAWYKMLKGILDRSITESEFAMHVAGRTNQDTFEYFLKIPLSNERLQELSNEKESIYQTLCLEDDEYFRLVRGLPEFLNTCKENDIHLNIATASEIDNVRFFFKYLNLDQWFDIDKVAYNDGNLSGKPAPDIFLKGMQRIMAKPSETAIIEDSKSGLLAAKNAQVAEVFQIVENADTDRYVGTNQVIADYLTLADTIIS